MPGQLVGDKCFKSVYPLAKLILEVPETKIAEFANSVDLDEVAHNEPPHLDLTLFAL